MNCPICQNEEIKDGQNFCQICGFDFKKEPKALTEEEIEKNMISDGILDELCAIAARLSEIYKSTGFTAINPWGEGRNVQLSDLSFRATFPEYETVMRLIGSEYPLELSAMRNGLKFFTTSDRP